MVPLQSPCTRHTFVSLTCCVDVPAVAQLGKYMQLIQSLDGSHDGKQTVSFKQFVQEAPSRKASNDVADFALRGHGLLFQRWEFGSSMYCTLSYRGNKYRIGHLAMACTVHRITNAVDSFGICLESLCKEIDLSRCRKNLRHLQPTARKVLLQALSPQATTVRLTFELRVWHVRCRRQ